MIGAKRVRAPDGTTWQVGRRWLPDKPQLWRRRKRKPDDSPAEHGSGGDWFSDLGFDAQDGRELSWQASDWRRSGRVRDDTAAALAIGHTDVRPSEALEPARP